MRILHTADWHLGDRLGRQDRTADLRLALERIAMICDTEKVDVLIAAGDLFSDKLRHQDDLRDTIEHIGKTFRDFLIGGGTILAVTGNHDKELPCQTLRHTLTLADPTVIPAGDPLRTGRFYLATNPSFVRVPDRSNEEKEVQFLQMPYPTPTRYFDGTSPGGATREEVNTQLKTAFNSCLERMMVNERFRKDLRSVLIAHIHAMDAKIRTGFRMTDAEDVLFDRVPTHFDYVALGHIHFPQAIGGEEHVRYSGSIEHLDLGEREYETGVVLVDLLRNGGREIRVIPLPATPIHQVSITDPLIEIPTLRTRYPDHENALVRYRLEWKPGEHNRDELVREIEEIFPRWYEREIEEVGKSRTPTQHASLPKETSNPTNTVIHFLEQELAENPERDAILTMARELIGD